MKRIALVVGVCVLTAAGCVSGLANTKENITRLPRPEQPPAVYPDQVNKDNAHEMAAALAAEMDFEARADVPQAR
jgi:hypothetical protein